MAAFTSYLEVLSEECNKDGVDVNLEVTNAEQRLTPEMELSLYRIVQEALRNVIRHSQATEVTVKLETDVKEANLSITDNGKGFTLPEVSSDLVGKGKLGLIGIQERTRLLGGEFLLTSDSGRGTAVVVIVPLTD